MVAGGERREIIIDDIDKQKVLCVSNQAIGNGMFQNIHDIVYIDPNNFDPSNSDQIAHELEQMNQEFDIENKNYILIGFGRWGT